MTETSQISDDIAEGYRDPSLESLAQEHTELLQKFTANPTYEGVRQTARSLQNLSLELGRVLPFYGHEYRNQGRGFIELAQSTMSAVQKFPEKITRTDGGDRSAHALIERTINDIRAFIETLTSSEAQ